MTFKARKKERERRVSGALVAVVLETHVRTHTRNCASEHVNHTGLSIEENVVCVDITVRHLVLVHVCKRRRQRCDRTTSSDQNNTDSACKEREGVESRRPKKYG